MQTPSFFRRWSTNGVFWGAPTWRVLHACEVHPEADERAERLLTGLQHILPCRACQRHHSKFIQESVESAPRPLKLASVLAEAHSKMSPPPRSSSAQTDNNASAAPRGAAAAELSSDDFWIMFQCMLTNVRSKPPDHFVELLELGGEEASSPSGVRNARLAFLSKLREDFDRDHPGARPAAATTLQFEHRMKALRDVFLSPALLEGYGKPVGSERRDFFSGLIEAAKGKSNGDPRALSRLRKEMNVCCNWYPRSLEDYLRSLHATPAYGRSSADCLDCIVSLLPDQQNSCCAELKGFLRSDPGLRPDALESILQRGPAECGSFALRLLEKFLAASSSSSPAAPLSPSDWFERVVKKGMATTKALQARQIECTVAVLVEDLDRGDAKAVASLVDRFRKNAPVPYRFLVHRSDAVDPSRLTAELKAELEKVGSKLDFRTAVVDRSQVEAQLKRRLTAKAFPGVARLCFGPAADAEGEKEEEGKGMDRDKLRKVIDVLGFGHSAFVWFVDLASGAAESADFDDPAAMQSRCDSVLLQKSFWSSAGGGGETTRPRIHFMANRFKLLDFRTLETWIAQNAHNPGAADANALLETLYERLEH